VAGPTPQPGVGGDSPPRPHHPQSHSESESAARDHWRQTATWWGIVEPVFAAGAALLVAAAVTGPHVHPPVPNAEQP
jgi:hypothetical protein